MSNLPNGRVTMTFPACEVFNIPDNIASLAEKRTAHLLSLAPRKPLIELLRDAYLQGVHDTAKSAFIELKWDDEPIGYVVDAAPSDKTQA